MNMGAKSVKRKVRSEKKAKIEPELKSVLCDIKNKLECLQEEADSKLKEISTMCKATGDAK